MKRPGEAQSTKSRPWYYRGLRFQCTGCGNCCTGDPGYVWVNDEEIAALAGLTGLEVEGFELQYVRQVGRRKSLIELPNGDCIFFDSSSRRCTVYGVRPHQCRTWPFWRSNIETPQAWEETSQACPGCGHGPLIPVKQIEAQASAVGL